jgi:hypothetical protein
MLIPSVILSSISYYPYPRDCAINTALVITSHCHPSLIGWSLPDYRSSPSNAYPKNIRLG